MQYKVMIGLEVHVQMNTRTKLFSNMTNSEANPNTNVDNIDIGIPGSLPRLNTEAINKAIKTGLALQCSINEYSAFDRKHYCYPDLPLGYQITQFYHPICSAGQLDTPFGKVRINRIHIEADAGKMIHTKFDSLLDFNRCSVPLMEIVTEPDMRSAEHVSSFLIELIHILKFIDTSNCNMEKGNLRVDINISIANDEKRYPRVEIKNVNSVNFVRKAVEVEINRQIQCVETKDYYNQHTRRYDSDTNTTIFMRSKEYELDYRYMPDFNIPAVYLNKERIQSIILPELPTERRIRYSTLIKNKEIPEILATDKNIGFYFDDISLLVKNFELAANFIVNDLKGDVSFPKSYLASIINMLDSGKISTKVAKYLISKFTILDPIETVIKEDLLQITDTKIIEKIVLEVIKENYEEFEKYKAGKIKLFQFFMGKCISKTNGRCNTNLLENVLKDKLDK